MDLRPVLQRVLAEYPLHVDGIHGVVHWARVLENGKRIAQESGADSEVVALFAVLHDSRRWNDGSDPDHGPRAAVLARELNGDVFHLDQAALKRLVVACEGHTHVLTHPDPTIQTCWDADRLDLGRVGITPHPSRLCTEFAKRPETIQWADERATRDHTPDFVHAEWLPLLS